MLLQVADEHLVAVELGFRLVWEVVLTGQSAGTAPAQAAQAGLVQRL
ncbi:hypothetical protein [Nonomuraea sp. NPDC049141]